MKAYTTKTIYITPKMKEVIDLFLALKSNYPVLTMAERLGITQQAVRFRIKKLKEKGLFTRQGKHLTYIDLPFVVQENISRKVKQQNREFNSTFNYYFEEDVLSLDKTEDPTRRIKIDKPISFSPVEFKNGRISRIPIPKYHE